MAYEYVDPIDELSKELRMARLQGELDGLTAQNAAWGQHQFDAAVDAEFDRLGVPIGERNDIAAFALLHGGAMDLETATHTYRFGVEEHGRAQLDDAMGAHEQTLGRPLTARERDAITAEIDRGARLTTRVDLAHAATGSNVDMSTERGPRNLLTELIEDDEQRQAVTDRADAEERTELGLDTQREQADYISGAFDQLFTDTYGDTGSDR